MRWIIAAFLVSFGTATQAEITIRSGEHESFTRLVFTTPAGLSWTVDQESNQATVTVENPDETFRISGIFDRIPRTRLLEVERLGAGALSLALDCSCPIEAFQYTDRAFVIDILDPSTDAVEQTEVSRTHTSAHIPLGRTLPILPDRKPQSSIVPHLGFRDLASTPTATQPPTPVIAEITPAERVRKQLLSQVQTALQRGDLSGDETRLLDMQDHQTGAPAAIRPTEPPSFEQMPEESAAAQLQAQIRVEARLDHALATAMTQFIGQQDDDLCIANEALDVASWSTGVGFQQEIGSLNRQLFGEFDRVDSDTATKLVKLYLSLGFGAEAIFVLELLGSTNKENDILRAIAETLEFGRPRSRNPFAQQAHCDSAAALWAVLSDKDFDADAQTNREAILFNFSTLPLHLRTYLGPVLSENLRKAGHVEIAEEAMDIVTRGSKTNDSPAKLELSHIALAQGNTEEALDGLNAVVDANAEPSPEALVELIDVQFINSTPIADATVALAAAYAFEFRDSEIGDELQRALVLALVRTDQFSTAIEELSLLEPRMATDSRKNLYASVISELTDRATDPVFISLIIPHFSERSSDLYPATENALASRLIEMGITTPTENLLAGSVNGADGRLRRILRARLALLQDRQRNALSSLLGLEGEDVILLRAQAYDELEEFDRAKELYAAAGATQPATDMALLARDWSFLANTGSSALQQTAQNAASLANTDLAIPSLINSENALAASARTQEMVQSLLTDYQVDLATPDLSQ